MTLGDHDREKNMNINNYQQWGKRSRPQKKHNQQQQPLMVLGNHDHKGNNSSTTISNGIRQPQPRRKHKQQKQPTMVPSEHNHEGNIKNNKKRWHQTSTTSKQNKPQTQLTFKFFHKSQISQNKANDREKNFKIYFLPLLKGTMPMFKSNH